MTAIKDFLCTAFQVTVVLSAGLKAFIFVLQSIGENAFLTQWDFVAAVPLVATGKNWQKILPVRYPPTCPYSLSLWCPLAAADTSQYFIQRLTRHKQPSLRCDADFDGFCCNSAEEENFTPLVKLMNSGRANQRLPPSSLWLHKGSG